MPRGHRRYSRFRVEKRQTAPRPEPDDRGKKEGGGNGFADAGILLDGAGSEIPARGKRMLPSGRRRQKDKGHCHPCQLTVGGEGLDGILPWSCSCLGIRRFSESCRNLIFPDSLSYKSRRQFRQSRKINRTAQLPHLSNAHEKTNQARNQHHKIETIILNKRIPAPPAAIPFPFTINLLHHASALGNS